MSNNLEIKTQALIVLPKNEPIFSDRATIIRIEDEAGGPYLELEQNRDDTTAQKILLDFEEWPLITEAVNRLAKEWNSE